jgi:magnesium chelatase family protein
MIASVHTGSLCGVDASGVRVEVDFTRGLPQPVFDIVGLPEAAVRESQVRVKAAIANSEFKLPERAFVVNLAPADVRKSGSSFDLAIAVALLSKCGFCAPNRLEETLIVGELSLDGSLRPVRGVLAQLRAAKQRGLHAAVIPDGDAQAASLATGIDVYRARRLSEVIDFLNNSHTLARVDCPQQWSSPSEPEEDLQDVRGQEAAKRALEVAAAGMHNLLLVGPPGTGKTMLARRLRGILPRPTAEEALEIATIAGAASVPIPATRQGVTRPFRAPHHTVSDVGLVGGGAPIRPGEVTLSHLGVLFLDELPEFRRTAIESLRPIMESGVSVIVRAAERIAMPARPLVVAAMNPCPCGYAGDKTRVCRCSPDQVRRYRARVSGPMLDRFDLHILLPPVRVSALNNAAAGETSAAVTDRVTAACARQHARVEKLRSQGSYSERRFLEQLGASIDREALQLLQLSMEKLGLSLRAYVKALKVSRTIADLEGRDRITADHVAEAVQYRLLDRDPDRESSAGRRRSPHTPPGVVRYV